MFLAGGFHYLKVARVAYPLFALTLLMLLALLVFGHLGRHVAFLRQMFPQPGGSFRWIRLPFVQIQPSEFLKITYVLALARYLRYRSNYRNLAGLIGPFAFTILPIVLIILEPDLGTAMLLLPVLFLMLFAAGARISHLAVIVLFMVLSFPGLFYLMAPYQKARFAGLLLQSPKARAYLKEHPKLKKAVYPKLSLLRWHQSPQGYQLYNSKLAVGSGGPRGYGGELGPYTEGTYRLPHCHNDFIFAIIGHQFGFVGTVLVILLYLVIAVGLIEIAANVTEPFGRLVAVGTFAMILAQSMINMAMTVGLMPITGVTLPFVSFGGSSMLTYFILIGLAISVDRTRPINIGPRPFEFKKKQ